MGFCEQGTLFVDSLPVLFFVIYIAILVDLYGFPLSEVSLPVGGKAF